MIEKLGEGGMGTVYKAVDQRLDRIVALKILSRLDGPAQEKMRLFREAKAASALNHPNIVTIYEYTADDEIDFIAMEYVQGSTLHELLAAGNVDLTTLLGYAAQAANAVAKAHDAGIVHRDLTPRNIMVTAERTVKVLDFGLARKQPGRTETTQTDFTRRGTVIGTPPYMSPEQARGEVVDHCSDIFSFGTVLYEIACRRRPFEGKDSLTVLYRIIHEDPPPPCEVDPSLPVALSALIQRCLAKEKKERVQSMVVVASELSALAGVGKLTPARGIVHTKRLAAALAFTLAAGVALSFIGVRWQYSLVGVHSAFAPAADRVIAYSIEAQRMEDMRPTGEPYMASPRGRFKSGSKFRLHLQSPQSGFLYLINCGSRAGQYWILYPKLPGLDATAIAPDQPVTTDWYWFDRTLGTERLWLVWSDKPIDLLRMALQGSNRGQVTNALAAKGIQEFLARVSSDSRTVVKESANSVQLRAAEGVLGGRVELRHE